MKIGFSFGRCIRDIVKGDVSIDDVMCIIARTYMETPEDMHGVVRQYHAYSHLSGLELDKCLEVANELYYQGKLHQPRLYGTIRFSVPEEYVWMDLMPTVKDMSPSVRDAWENYKMMLKLCASETEPDEANAPKS